MVHSQTYRLMVPLAKSGPFSSEAVVLSCCCRPTELGHGSICTPERRREVVESALLSVGVPFTRLDDLIGAEDNQPGDPEEPGAQLPVEALIESNDAMRGFFRSVSGVVLTDTLLQEMRELLDAAPKVSPGEPDHDHLVDAGMRSGRISCAGPNQSQLPSRGPLGLPLDDPDVVGAVVDAIDDSAPTLEISSTRLSESPVKVTGAIHVADETMRLTNQMESLMAGEIPAESYGLESVVREHCARISHELSNGNPCILTSDGKTLGTFLPDAQSSLGFVFRAW